MSRPILAITGMHRSGTSLLSQYLSECGLLVGQALLDGGVVSESSRGGHHEDEEFVELHKKILGDNHSSIFVTSERRLPLKVSARRRQRSAKLLKARQDWPQWGWKDPRTALLLDLWAGESDRIKFLFIFREPLQVTDSLLRRGRNKMITQEPAIALQSWLVYNRQILDFARRYPSRTLLVEVEDFIAQPETVTSALSDRFGFDMPAVPLENFFSEGSFKRSRSLAVETLAKTEYGLLASCLNTYESLKTESLKTESLKRESLRARPSLQFSKV